MEKNEKNGKKNQNQLIDLLKIKIMITINLKMRSINRSRIFEG